ncbi:MAG TPA: C13 family peptidase [Steroidobacteraceae bacterium]|nr:C13 family peptidase [Steroidobacteraceae bacterium]
MLAGLVRNLSGGLALICLRRRWPPRFTVGFDQLAALLLVNLLVWALLDRLHAERHAEFVADGLFGWACYLLLALIGCALVARAQDRAAPTRALLTVALSAAPFALTALWLLGDLDFAARHPLAAAALAILYLALLALRVLGAAFGPVRLKPALLAVALVLASPWTLAWLDLDTRLWVLPDTTEAQDDLDPGEAEALLYDQPARIAEVVARVTPSEPPTPHAYFVGFAGDAQLEVFSRETQFARQVFAARFGSADRSVLLVNDAGDRDTWPIASLSGLAQALKLLAARMDPDEDVLVLFLTSHGSEDGLEVRNGSLPLAQLEPEDLRQALDDSGIRWRLVVVSACYAGVFIDALKNDTTAIVTAADATHSSFGCQEDRELTWFGEAFLRDSLPGSSSLEAAYAKAARLIAEREDAEHQVHSNPQLWIGAQMRDKLRMLEGARPALERSPVIVRR